MAIIKHEGAHATYLGERFVYNPCLMRFESVTTGETLDDVFNRKHKKRQTRKTRRAAKNRRRLLRRLRDTAPKSPKSIPGWSWSYKLPPPPQE